MANAPDTLVLTGPNEQQVALADLLITPSGGTQAALKNLINGGTVAQTLASGSTVPNPAVTGIMRRSVTNAITASTTQTLAGAVALTSTWNVISTVGTAGDAVKLPAVNNVNAGEAQEVWIINNGASLCQIFAAESATAIDSHATAAAATLTAAHRAIFVQNTASTWVSVASVSAAT